MGMGRSYLPPLFVVARMDQFGMRT